MSAKTPTVVFCKGSSIKFTFLEDSITVSGPQYKPVMPTACKELICTAPGLTCNLDLGKKGNQAMARAILTEFTPQARFVRHFENFGCVYLANADGSVKINMLL